VIIPNFSIHLELMLSRDFQSQSDLSRQGADEWQVPGKTAKTDEELVHD
jgi:hypothetical protein